ncbi:hypothetical protein AAFF_G00213610 [Aldrovandia affinis]|uniref:Uncharacterized protein n=1 Tax=Aldrovandia affinis TaxID=143900 RepID=A0AAD7RGT3_9TELE|nr:hypothetical protein AAFF_G00213610 [Aldrovandia affinis]
MRFSRQWCHREGGRRENERETRRSARDFPPLLQSFVPATMTNWSWRSDAYQSLSLSPAPNAWSGASPNRVEIESRRSQKGAAHRKRRAADWDGTVPWSIVRSESGPT